MRPLFRLILALTLLSSVVARGAASEPGRVALGSIRLLPGYEWQQGRGADSSVGKIWRKGGPTISYDIGGMAGNQVEHKVKTGDYLWRKEQRVSGSAVQIVVTKGRQLLVTFPADHANFFCQLRSDEDLADALLMLLTYRSVSRKR